MESTYPKVKHHAYAPENILQSVSVYLQEHPAQASGYWVLSSYIHGGAWRDPSILASTFDTTRSVLTTDEGLKGKISAYASIDYRLSPHPSFPPATSISSTVDNGSNVSDDILAADRTAVHPAHLHDVRAALSFLSQTYSVPPDRFILVGHSAGATLAFQTVSNLDHTPGPTTTASSSSPPVTDLSAVAAIAGVCGIYDLRLLRDAHVSISAYGEIIRGAFGDDEEEWDRVSPGRGEVSLDGWRGRVAVLARSSGDELVDEPQMESMRGIVEEWKTKDALRRVVLMSDLRDGHDEVWKNGTELASVIRTTIQELEQIR